MKNKGCFSKGHVPWNKGLHIDLSHGKGQFKKGTIPPKTKPIGCIQKHKDGYRYIKLTHHKWELYQRYLYEKAHKCKVPKSHIIMFLDGDKDNLNIDNLVEITRHESSIINHEHLQTKGNSELSRTGILIAKLKAKIKEVS